MTHMALSGNFTIAMACAGLAVGYLYFTTLKRTVSLLVLGRGWFPPLALTLGRLGTVALFLIWVAKRGAAPLLAAVVGLLLARTLALRAARRAA